MGRRGLVQRLRRAGAWAAPYGLVAPRRERYEAELRRLKAEREAAAVDRAQDERRQLLGNLPLPDEAAVPFDYEAAVAFLVESGLSENQVRAGSMPPASLNFIGELFAEHLPEGPSWAFTSGTSSAFRLPP